MKPIFLSSVLEYSGKSMVALGLAKNFQGKIGYYKPFREEVLCINHRVVDRDAHMMKIALGLEFSDEQLSPLKYDIFNPVSMEQVVDGFQKVKGDAKTHLIEGAQLFSTGARHHLEGMSIAERLGADVILVSTPAPDAIDRISIYQRLMEKGNPRLKGVIINMCDDPTVERLFEGAGIKVLGTIPVVKELGYPHVSEIAAGLNAEVLAGEAGLDKFVEKIMVGGMTAEAAMKEMRRLSRKVMVTGGDRSDMLMAALATDTSCLVLTGGLYPAKPVLAKAQELNVPVLLVGHGTQVASDMVENLIARIQPNDTNKIELITDLVRRHVDLEAVWGE